MQIYGKQKRMPSCKGLKGLPKAMLNSLNKSCKCITKSFCQFCQITILTGPNMFFLDIMFGIVGVVLYFRTYSQHQTFCMNGKSTGVTPAPTESGTVCVVCSLNVTTLARFFMSICSMSLRLSLP